MKTKILLWSVASTLIVGIIAAAVWWEFRPQVITLDSGDKVTLLSVEYGKKHVPPGAKASSAAAARARGGRGAAFTTPTDTLVLWVRQEHDPKQYANFQYYLYDKAGTACVGSSGVNWGNGNRQQGNEVVAVQFSAFPRRQGKFFLRVQEYVPNVGQVMSDKHLVISNPAHKSFSEWTPESLPATKDDDDLSVTMKKLVFGAGSFFIRDPDNPHDPINKGVQAAFHVERNGKPVNNWQPVSVVISDATGNSISGGANIQLPDGNDITTGYQFGLWPDEAAWKLRLEFSQHADFTDSELWTVQAIPLKPGLRQDFWNYNNYNRRTSTDPVFAETDLNGYHLKLFPAKQFTDAPANSNPQGGFYIQIEPPLKDGMRLTVVKLMDDQTNDVEFWENNWSGSLDQCQLRDIGGATNLNLTIALHKSRFVEFTAKPEKADAPAAQQ